MSHALNPLPVCLAVTALLVLSGCDGATTSAEQTPTSSSGRATSSEPGNGTAAAADEPRSMTGVDGPLDAGRWSMALWTPEDEGMPRPVVEVPAGYETPGGGVVYREGESSTGEVSFWTVSQVYDDACKAGSAADPGPSVDNLADALAAQDGHRTTSPEPVTVDGHAGRYLELTWPGPAALEECRDSRLSLWRTGAGSFGRSDAGTVLRLWIVDVEGTRVVVTASTTPQDDQTETAELVSIATSTHFTDPAEAAG